MESYAQLKEIFARLSHLTYIKNIMNWDEAVMMPEGSGQARADAMGTFNHIAHKMLVQPKIKNLIKAAKESPPQSLWDQANLHWMEKLYQRAACIPARLAEQFTKSAMTTEQAWRKLRAENNWREFYPYLQKTFKIVKEMANRRAESLQLSPYDALIDQFAPGFNQKSIDAIFSELKKTLPELVQQIRQKQGQEHIIPLQGPFSIEKQKLLGLKVMEMLRFNFQQGRLDVSHHPFCGGDSSDIRITTRYREDEFLSSLMGICHETGHALYEQGLSKEWIDQPVGEASHSMAMHESQSLLIEREVCCSFSFFKYFVPLAQSIFGEQPGLTVENLYKINARVEPSLIRVDADEVTYPLHVILRYEIEKGLFAGDIQVKDLPECWNDFMVKYFDISTKNNDKDGVMQDVHWAAGLFGYFPAYTLGRLIAAQFFETFAKSNSQFAHQMEQGNFQPLKQWLNENVYAYASSLPTQDLLMKVTKSPLNVQFFVDRIKKRYC